MKKVVFYTNQYFGQIGGEDKAGALPEIREGAVGAANALSELIEGGEIVATIICGDNFYAENMEKARELIGLELEKLKPDMLIAGPAFNAGRFGMACGDICNYVEDNFSIPTLTGMYHENPAVEIYKSGTFIIETKNSAAGMKSAAADMAKAANKLLSGEGLNCPECDRYIPKGIRVNLFSEKTGAERAVDMLVAKLAGEPYKTEIPLPEYQAITPAAGVENLKGAKVALLTSGGIVPFGNPDRLPAATAKFFKQYDIKDVDALKSGEYMSVHAGYDPVYADENPNRVAPVDMLKKLKDDGEIGEVYEYLTVTTGNSTSVADATRMGQEIAVLLKDAGVDAAIMTST